MGSNRNDYPLTNTLKIHDSFSPDSRDNIYLTGFTNGSIDGNSYAGNSDVFFVKYNSSGVKQ